MSIIKENYDIIKINENEYINENGEKIIEKIIFVREGNNLENNNKWMSQKKYYEKNKDKVNEYTKEHRKERYRNDEEFRNKVLAKKREYYHNKKNGINKNTPEIKI